MLHATLGEASEQKDIETSANQIILFALWLTYWILTRFKEKHFWNICLYWLRRGRRGRDRMVIGFTTTCAINAYHQYMLWVQTPFIARCTFGEGHIHVERLWWVSQIIFLPRSSFGHYMTFYIPYTQSQTLLCQFSVPQ